MVVSVRAEANAVAPKSGFRRFRLEPASPLPTHKLKRQASQPAEIAGCRCCFGTAATDIREQVVAAVAACEREQAPLAFAASVLGVGMHLESARVNLVRRGTSTICV